MSKIIQLKGKNNTNLYPNIIQMQILNYIYPVGSIYISTSNNNPANFIGGTWVVFGQGRVLVGVDTNQAEFNTVLKTGGEKTHKLTENELASHKHQQQDYTFVGGGSQSASGYGTWWGQAVSYTKYTGGDQPHNNLQPYICVYMFRRTA